MAAQHAVWTLFPSAPLDGRSPRATVVVRVPIVGDVNGVGTTEAVFDRYHGAPRSLGVVSVGHYGESLPGRAQKNFLRHPLPRVKTASGGRKEYASGHSESILQHKLHDARVASSSDLAERASESELAPSPFGRQR